MSKSKKFKTKLVRMSLMAIAATGLTITALTLGLGVFSNSVFAEPSANGSNPATSRFAVTLKEIIALRILDKTASSEISNLTLDITPTPNGVFTKGSFIAETSTSNATGYKLYLTSTGKDHLDTYTNSLINIDSSVEPSVGTIPSLASGASVTEAAFRVNNSAYKNKWGYSTNGLIVNATTNNGATTIDSIADNTNTSEITYADVPENAESRQIDSRSEAIDKGMSPITIGSNVSSAITSGIYNNTLELTAIANPLPLNYSLTFDANTEEAVTNMPEENPMMETSVASQVSFIIPDVVPKGDQWLFKEWNTEPDGSGVSYLPGSDFTITADTTLPNATKKTLYAIWETVVAFTSGGLTWTKQLGATTFSNASSLCPTGYRLPSSSELDRLIGSPNYGWSTSSSVRTTYNAWSIGDGRYNSSYVWSSTRWSSGSRTGAYNLYYESSSRAIVTVIQQNWTSAQYQVACVK